MSREKIELLEEELAGLKLAAGHLAYSMERCTGLLGLKDLPPELLERLESLTSRFARLADLMIQRIFRLMDEVELTGSGTLLDRIYRAEKRGWGEAHTMIRIRELRNLIAHEYSNDKMQEIYAAVAQMSTALLVIVPTVTMYATSLIRRYQE